MGRAADAIDGSLAREPNEKVGQPSRIESRGTSFLPVWMHTELATDCHEIVFAPAWAIVRRVEEGRVGKSSADKVGIGSRYCIGW